MAVQTKWSKFGKLVAEVIESSYIPEEKAGPKISE
jgi:hypothetical protein